MAFAKRSQQLNAGEGLPEAGLEPSQLSSDAVVARVADARHDSMRLALRVSEVAKALDVSEWLVYDLVASGHIRSVRLGRVLRIPMVALSDFLAPPTEALGNPSRLIVGGGAAPAPDNVQPARPYRRSRPVDEPLDPSVNGVPALRNGRGRGGNG